MKKIKLFLTLLMISAMLILPTSLSVQAEEIGNFNIKGIDDIEKVAIKAVIFEKNAIVTGDGVNLRNSSWTVLEKMYKGETIYLDFDDVKIWNGNVMVHCKRAKTGTEGYFSNTYVKTTN